MSDPVDNPVDDPVANPMANPMANPVQPGPEQPPAPPVGGYGAAYGVAPPPGYGGPHARYAPPTQYPGQQHPGQPAAPYAYPAAPAAAPAAPAAPVGRGIGVVALVLSIIATLGAAVVGAIAAYEVARGTALRFAAGEISADFDWSILTPVREWVVLAESSFWVGTVVGIWALVQGVIAIVKNRGRAAGIAAVVIAALGPVIFFLVVQGALGAGFAAGAGAGLGG